MRLSLAELRQHPGRLGAVVVAVAISVAFMVASVGVVQTEFGAAGDALAREYADSDLVVQAGVEDPDQVGPALAAVPGVDVVEPLWSGGTSLRSGDRGNQASVHPVSEHPRLRPAELGEGRWPTTPQEVVLDAGTAEALEVGVGAQVEMAPADGGDLLPVQVVGVTAPAAGLMSTSYPTVYAVPAWFTAGGSELSAWEWLVLLDPGTDPQTLVAPLETALRALPGAQLEEGAVRTTEAAAAAAVDSLAGDASVLTVMLLVFASIAMLVGALIVANTFAILVVQRRRQIALLRAVGGSTGQLRGGLVLESALIGAAGALTGLAVGVLLTLAVTWWTGSLGSGLRLPLGSALGAVAAGVVVTVLASLAAVGRAASIAPLEALRPVATPAASRRIGIVRAVVCSLLLVAGAVLAGAALGLDPSSTGLPAEVPLLLAIGAGVSLTLGVLGGAPLYVRPLLRLAGQPARLLGPVGRMSVASLVRNPQRAAATCVALMLAVGLTVTLQTGAATTQQTLLGDIRERYPVDVSLADVDADDLDADLVGRLSSVEGVTDALPVAAAQARLTLAGEERYLFAYGVDPERAAAFLPEPLPGLDATTVVVSPGPGVEPGERVTLTLEEYDEQGEVTSSRSGTFTTVLSHGAHGNALISPEAFATLAGAGNTAGLWLRVDPRADIQRVSTDITSLTDGSGGTLVDSGSLREVVGYTTALDTLVLIATALLAAAVLISLIGVGNTLALSVVERTRESALLRALGLQRAQLRTMLLLEALLLAVVGAVVGVLAGCFFGWLGASALMVVLEQEGVQFAVSWPQTLGVLAVALVAAALASVLPGRRASAASPVTALAAE
nr:ABC transporter permease [Auraticoccus cholistanensis]